MINFILLTTSITCLIVSFVVMLQVRRSHNKHQVYINDLQKSTDQHLKISQTLFKFISSIQSDQKLEILAIEKLSNNQKLSDANVEDLREQMHTILTSMIRQIADGYPISEPAKIDNDKLN